MVKFLLFPLKAIYVMVVLLWNISLDFGKAFGSFIAYTLTGIVLPIGYISLFIGSVSKGYFIVVLSIVLCYCVAYGVSYAKHGTIKEFWRGPKCIFQAW